jgi:hypothetical protein
MHSVSFKLQTWYAYLDFQTQFHYNSCKLHKKDQEILQVRVLGPYYPDQISVQNVVRLSEGNKSNMIVIGTLN